MLEGARLLGRLAMLAGYERRTYRLAGQSDVRRSRPDELIAIADASDRAKEFEEVKERSRTQRQRFTRSTSPLGHLVAQRSGEE